MPGQPKHGPAPGLSPEELEAEQATELPEREALSIVDPGVFSVAPVPIGRTADGANSGEPPLLDESTT